MRQRAGDSVFLLVCVAAAVLSTTAISALPLYLESVESLGLARMTKSLPPSGKGAWVQAREIAFNPGAIDATVDALDGMEEALGRLAGGKTVFVRSGRLSAREQNVTGAASLGGWHYQSIKGSSQAVEYVSGTAPADGDIVEVAIAATVAESRGINLGDQFRMTVPPTDIVHSEATVVGTFEPHDSDGVYWQGLYSTLMAPMPASSSGTPPIIALVDDAKLRRLASGSIADLGEVWAVYYADIGSLMRLGVAGSVDAIEGFRSYVSHSLPTAISVVGIQSALETVQIQLAFARLSIQVVGTLMMLFLVVLLFALARMVSGMRDVERMRLEARGATRYQVSKTFLAHGCLLMFVPTAIGPLLSAMLLPMLGRTAGFAEMTGGALLDWSLTWEQFAIAGVAAFAVTVYYFWPAIMTRISPVFAAWISGRHGSRLWIWRANLDVIAVVAAFALIYEAGNIGSFVTTDGAASVAGSAMPIAASIIVALTGLRVLRVMGGAFGKLSGLPRLATLGVTFAIFGRSVMRHAKSSLMAGGVMVVAVISLGLQSTVAANASDQASFAAVADVRLTNIDGHRAQENLDVQSIEKLDWVDGVSWSVRTRVRSGTTDQAVMFDVLAVEPEKFVKIAWFRDDFAEHGLDDLMVAVTEYAEPDGLAIPDDATRVTLQARLAHEGTGRMDIWARVADSTGTTHTLQMEMVNTTSQTVGAHQFTSLIKPDLPRPIKLSAIVVYEPPVSPLGTSAQLDLFSLTSVGGDGSSVSITDFEDASNWHPVETSIPEDTAIEAVHDGLGEVAGLRVSMGRGTDDGLRGIYFSSTGAIEVPILVNESFLRETGLVVGDSFTGNSLGRFVPFVIRGSYLLFPSHELTDEPNAVTNVNALLHYITPVSEPFLGDSAELIAEVHGNSTAVQRRDDVKGINPSIGIVDRGLIESVSAGELASLAGWRYVGIAASAIGTVIGCLALFAFGFRFMVDSARDRALMEAIGVSRGFMKFDGAVTLAIPVAFGLAIGTISGTFGVWWMADNMTRVADGSVAVPPLQLVIPWTAMVAIAVLSFVVAVIPATLADFVERRTVASRLRSAAVV